MPLKVADFQSIIESIAPLSLKEDYDNVGLMTGDGNNSITSVLAALDCTIDVIEEAIEKNCNLIFTHHPLLFLKPSSVSFDTLIGRKLQLLIKHDISVYSSHTNLDSTAGGVSDCFAKLLGFNEWEVMERTNALWNKDITNVGAGRLIKLEESQALENLCRDIKSKLGISYLRYSGDLTKPISRIALLNGSGEDYFALAKDYGADCIVTGDTKYHYISDYNEMGIAIIDAGHFETEWPAFRLFLKEVEYRLLSIGLSNCIIESEKCRSPYNLL